MFTSTRRGSDLAVLISTALLLLANCTPRVAVANDDAAAAEGPESSDRNDAYANFHVVSNDALWPRDCVAMNCARLRRELQKRWFPSRGNRWPAWDPPCEVVIHADEGAYLRHVGWRSALTRGLCKIDVRGGQIVSRRIDLVADPATHELTALPHELTHAVLADQFITHRLPRWLDEGLALLADDPYRQHLHLQTTRQAVQAGRLMPLLEMVYRDRYPTDSELIVFYGQSLSLTRFLTELDEPHKVLDFASLAMQRGYDQSLQEVYGIGNLRELESRWLASLESPASETRMVASSPEPLRGVRHAAGVSTVLGPAGE